jgi:hypothetical protein
MMIGDDKALLYYREGQLHPVPQYVYDAVAQNQYKALVGIYYYSVRTVPNRIEALVDDSTTTRV